ncbi:MAG TPA: polysaccharide deacetylase family protein [Solirubrobacteraceae bacterium]|jgi:peptidoglycan/xylan/chitin deacetylase (PgdA/CDA1 family)|nr:polysaccharide deacetylase family protein [Solirubrobacteraceae bacterium]
MSKETRDAKFTGASLTFDDGPDETWTPRVLEELARLDAHATFFVVGDRVVRDPELIAMIAAAGHDVQLHCHRHIRHTKLTEDELQRDTERALQALQQAGVRPALWRAPWGITTPASRRVAHSLGLRLVRWSIDTHDWRGDGPAKMLAAAQPHLPAGGAVLMHDALGPGAQRSGAENTVALLAPLVEAIRRHDGEPATLIDIEEQPVTVP